MCAGRVVPYILAGRLFVWCVIVVTFNGFVQSCISYPARGTLFPKFSKAFICSACVYTMYWHKWQVIANLQIISL